MIADSIKTQIEQHRVRRSMQGILNYELSNTVSDSDAVLFLEVYSFTCIFKVLLTEPRELRISTQ